MCTVHYTLSLRSNYNIKLQWQTRTQVADAMAMPQRP